MDKKDQEKIELFDKLMLGIAETIYKTRTILDFIEKDPEEAKKIVVGGSVHSLEHYKLVYFVQLDTLEKLLETVGVKLRVEELKKGETPIEVYNKISKEEGGQPQFFYHTGGKDNG